MVQGLRLVTHFGAGQLRPGNIPPPITNHTNSPVPTALAGYSSRCRAAKAARGRTVTDNNRGPLGPLLLVTYFCTGQARGPSGTPGHQSGQSGHQTGGERRELRTTYAGVALTTQLTSQHTAGHKLAYRWGSRVQHGQQRGETGVKEHRPLGRDACTVLVRFSQIFLFSFLSTVFVHLFSSDTLTLKYHIPYRHVSLHHIVAKVL